MKTNVKNYSDKQLLDRVKSLPDFKYIPSDYWILGVQSQEDEFNKFDDKFYLFRGEEFITVTSGTTNPGKSGLLNWMKYHRTGVAVWKTDQWAYRVWKGGLHKGKMKALRQIRPVYFYRDNNANNKSEQIGKLYYDVRGFNFHSVSYNKFKNYFLTKIGGWSVGCQVVNYTDDYYNILGFTHDQDNVSYCLLKEF